MLLRFSRNGDHVLLRVCSACVLHCAASDGDVENARLAFQNALADEAMQQRPELWRYFQAFEVQHGTLQDILQVESGQKAALPRAGVQQRTLAALDRLRRRYTHFDLWPCTLAQRAHLEPLLDPDSAATARCAHQLQLLRRHSCTLPKFHVLPAPTSSCSSGPFFWFR